VLKDPVILEAMAELEKLYADKKVAVEAAVGDYGKWIGQRPLLILGVLLMIIGIQTIFFGLMAEMMNFLSGKGAEPSISQILRKK
jgi:hypothetical protein